MPRGHRVAWGVLAVLALATRLQLALGGQALFGFDAVPHVTYVFFLDVYRALPLADQGWMYFQPPLYYALGWLLAQLDGAEAFARGLALWGSAASLSIAALSAAVVRMGLPERPGLALWAFAAVAFLPVQVYASPMPGNELTASLLGVAAVVSHVASQRHAAPGWLPDARTGILAGAALLTKYSALIPLLAIAAHLGLRALRDPRRRARSLRGLAVIVASGALVCGGYYARNVAELGTPLPMKGHRPVLDAYEAGQPPGQRDWRDLVRVSPRLFRDPSPLAPHMLHSIWGSAWAGVWVHLDRHGSNLPEGTTRILLALGVVPTLLAAFGLALALGEVRRRRDAHLEATLVLLFAVGLAAFIGFAFATPTFAALKPLYLLSLSPAYGFFVARSLAALGPASGPGRAARAALGAAVLASAWAYTPGLGLPRPGRESVQMAPVHRHFGDLAAAERIYRRELAETLGEPVPGRGRRNRFWARGMLAATLLEAGQAAEARDLYAESFGERPDAPDRGTLPRSSPWVINRVAVAAALAGDRELALGLLGTLGEPPAELLVNRAALLALGGDLDGAEAELRHALEEIPDLAPALLDLAWVRERRGEADAASLRARGREAAQRAPRGYPYWVGDGRGLNTQIPMLVLRGESLELYRPARARPVRTRPAADGSARPRGE